MQYKLQAVKKERKTGEKKKTLVRKPSRGDGKYPLPPPTYRLQTGSDARRHFPSQTARFRRFEFY